MDLTPNVTAGASGAVAGAVVTTLLTVIAAGARRGWRWMRSKVAADHQALYTPALMAGNGRDAAIYLTVRCAVSKRTTAKHFDKEAAVDLVRNTFCDVFGLEPNYSDNTHIRFDGPDYATLTIWRHGTIQLQVPLPGDLVADGKIDLSLVDACVPVASLHLALTAERQRAIYGRRGRWDWHVSLTPYATVDGAWHPWRPVFPGRAPRGHATDTVPPIAQPGYGHPGVLSLRAGRDAGVLLTIVLTDMLERLGYRGYDEAVADTLAAIGDAHRARRATLLSTDKRGSVVAVA